MGKGEGQGDGSGWGWGQGSGSSRGQSERVAVPAMPMPLAILCCVLNFLIPGLGTILAGFSVFCCARNEDMTCCKRLGSCCISFGIGLLQLLLTALLLLGWIWSCVWGVFFLGMSSEYYHDNPPDNGRGHVITQQPQTQANVVIQPSPGGYQYPQGGAGYQQPQGGAGYQQPQGYQPQPQWQPQHQPQPGVPPQQYGQPQPQQGVPSQGYGGPGPGPSFVPPYAGELPPPYSETEPASPSAPPVEKMKM